MYYLLKILEGLVLFLAILFLGVISTLIGILSSWLLSFVVDTHLDMFVGMVIGVLAFLCFLIKLDI